MPVIGIHLTKIVAEKKPGAGGKISINNNISVIDVQEKDFSLGTSKQKGLRFHFKFTCSYSPEMGSIDLEGDVLFIGEDKKVESIKKTWAENKKLDEEVVEPVLNSALTTCNLEAIKLSTDLNLPSPIMLPRLEKKAKKQEKA